eukprot:11210309-Lingulodinium_polyedra.AAC.1
MCAPVAPQLPGRVAGCPPRPVSLHAVSGNQGASTCMVCSAALVMSALPPGQGTGVRESQVSP